jgi:hypothetical protein
LTLTGEVPLLETKQTVFTLEAQLPRQSRTDTPVAASEKMWVVLQTSATDGENGLHAPTKTTHLSSFRARLKLGFRVISIPARAQKE